LKIEGKYVHFIIKKWELENGGRGGSKYLCERQAGDMIKGV
jgi:hypothetical protein